jgi:hypothetical protein
VYVANQHFNTTRQHTTIFTLITPPLATTITNIIPHFADSFSMGGPVRRFRWAREGKFRNSCRDDFPPRALPS